jgi:hypothetical protein
VNKKTTELTALDETIKVVFIQMQVTQKFAPDIFYQMAKEQQKKELQKVPGKENKDVFPNGEIAILPAEHVDASGLPDALRSSGFVFVDAVAHFEGYKNKYVVPRLVFSRDPAQVAAVSEKKRAFLDGAVRREMVTLLSEAVYDATVYRNPSVYKGEVVKDRNHFSVNLIARCTDNVPVSGKLTVEDGRIAIVSPEEEQ